MLMLHAFYLLFSTKSGQHFPLTAALIAGPDV